MAAQVTHLVNHLIASGTDWGRMYAEAVTGRFLATHGTIHERWYDAIVSELVWRGKFSFPFRYFISPSLPLWFIIFLLLSLVFSSSSFCRTRSIDRVLLDAFPQILHQTLHHTISL
jgi:hypothetical protein